MKLCPNNLINALLMHVISVDFVTAAVAVVVVALAFQLLRLENT